MANFSLTGVLRFDTAGIDAGVQHGIAQAKSFASQAAEVNRQLQASLAKDIRHDAAVLKAHGEQMSPENRARVEADLAAATERKATLQQEQAGRADLQRRLAVHKQKLAIEKQAAVESEQIAMQAAQEHFAIENESYNRQIALAKRAAEQKRNIDGGAGGGGAGMTRREAKASLKFGMGMAVGQTGEAGSLLAHGMMAETAAASGILIGLAAVGMAYEHSQKMAAELVVKQQQHAQATKDSVEWMHKLAESYETTKRAGDTFRKRAEEEAKAAEKVYEESKKAQAEIGLLKAGTILLESAFSGGVENTSYGKGVAQDIAQFQERKDRQKDFLRFSQEEWELEKKIRAERAGGNKERIDFEVEYATRKKEIDKLDRRFTIEGHEFFIGSKEQQQAILRAREDLAKFKADKEKGFAEGAGGEATLLANRTATAKAELEHDKNARELLAFQQQQAKEEADPERRRLRGAAAISPFARTTEQLAEADAARTKLQAIDEARGLEGQVLQQKLAKESAHLKAAAHQAEIMQQKAGYARDLALLKAHHAQELADDEHTGEARLAIIARQKSEEAALRARADEQIADQLRTIQEQTAVALQQKTAQQVQWEGMQRQLEQLGATKEKVDELKAAFDALNKAKAEEGILKTMKELDITIALATGKMTKAEADMARLQLANPNVRPELLKDLHGKQQQAEQAEFAKGEKDKLKTKLDAYKEYRAKLDAAVNGGNMTQAQENALLQKKMGELLPHDEQGGRRGNQGVGRWEDAASRYQSITSALLKGDGDKDLLKVTKGQADDVKELREENRRLTNIINGGITLKTPTG